jgi:hypothetical protein
MMTKAVRVGMIGDHVLSPLRSKNSMIVEVYVALGQEPTSPSLADIHSSASGSFTAGVPSDRGA